MRRLAIVLVAACVSGPAVRGQTSQAPVFRGGVTLVPVDVTVLDHEERPVPGLSAADFEVKLDGHVQPVRTVAYEEVALPSAATRAGTPTAAPPREATNTAPPAEPRLFVVMLDDLSITPARGKGMFFAATHFVDSLPISDVVGFTTSSGMATLNPTRNRQAVDAALRHAVGEFNDPRDLMPEYAVGLAEALEVRNGDDTTLQQIIQRDCFGGRTATQTAIASSSCAEQVTRKVRMVGDLSVQTAANQIRAYLNVINAMKPAPGLKELVLISDGLGVASREQLTRFEPVAKAAAAAGVQLSVLSQDPDMSDASKGGGTAQAGTTGAAIVYADNRTLVMDLQTMTDMAGGTFYRVMGQPDRFFNDVAVATSAVYHLGVEAPAGSAPGRDFKLSARVTRSGLTVHANHVALAPAAPVVVPVEDQLRAAVVEGLPNYGVPITVATIVRRGNTGTGLDVDANLEVPGSAPGPLTVMFGIVDAAGKLRSGRKVIEAPTNGDYRVSLSLPAPSGNYRLRFGVADANGHVGSIDVPVTVQLARVGPFLVSDVMSSWSDADGKLQFLALEEVPTAATALHTFLELYAPADAPLPSDVGVEWSLVGSAPEPAAVQSVVPVQADDRLTASGLFALENLAPGTYELRAAVFVAGRPVGTVSTTIRKAAPGPARRP